MKELVLYLYSIRKRDKISLLSDDNLSEDVLDNIWSTITRGCGTDSLRNGGVRLLNNDKTRNTFNDLVTKYALSTNNRIRRLTGLLKEMTENEAFYIFEEKLSSLVERRTAIDVLNYAPDGKGYIAIHNDRFHHYTVLSNTFTLLSYGFDGLPVFVGEREKAKRKCRFCGCVDPAKFNDVAHAIPEALGNKSLVCYEECDDCNHTLNKIEEHFVRFMDIRRSIYRIARKESTRAINVIGENFLLRPNTDGDAELYIMEDAVEPLQDKPDKFFVQLNNKSTVTNEKMYKALVKMVIDLIPTKYLNVFGNTIKWIRSDNFRSDSLPSFMSSVVSDRVLWPYPMLDILINENSKQKDAPYCTGILYIYDMMYMFVVPFADEDRGMYKYDKDLLSGFWKLMMRLFPFTWYMQNTSKWWSAVPWVKEIFDYSNPRVHILPKEDPVFDDSRKCKPIIAEVEYPVFDEKNVNLNRLEKISYQQSYKGERLSVDDLRDVTMTYTQARFDILINTKQIRCTIEFEAKDTTNTIDYYNVAISILYDIKDFEQFVKWDLDSNSVLDSCSIDYHLSNSILASSLRLGESQIRNRRKCTSFEYCSLVKLLDNERQLLEGFYYVFVIGEFSYCISYKDMHGLQ